MKTFSLAAILMATLTVMMVNASGADEDDVMMTGTIVAIEGDELRIRAADIGVQTFKFREGVERPANLAVGTEVTMWVDEDDADDNPLGEKVESETYTIHRITVNAPVERRPAPTASPTPATAPADEPATRVPDELPQTASPLAAIGVAGLLAIAGGLGLRMTRRRAK